MNQPIPAPWDQVENTVAETPTFATEVEPLSGQTSEQVGMQTFASTTPPSSSPMSPTYQSVVVQQGGKGPKVPMIIAAVLVGFGLVGFVVGAIAGASVEDTFNGLSTVEYTTAIGTNGTLEFQDADGFGEEGWYLLIPGDPDADEDNNGISDACEGIEFFITDAEGNDVSERVARFSCSTNKGADGSNAGEPYFDIEDHIIVARICYTLPDDLGEVEHQCEVGESFNVSNNGGVNMSVVDLDGMYIPFLEEIIGASILSGTSFLAGCCSLCGGGVALVVGAMRFGGNKKGGQPQVQFQIQ